MKAQPPHSKPPGPDLAARLREAQDGLRARDDFLSVAAHELRSPMNALGLHLAALERMAADGAQPRLLDEIRRARRNVQRYIRRATLLLDVSRINADQLQPAPAPVALREMVAGVIDTHADEAAFKGVTLQGQVDADHVGLWDPQMVEQMLSNLVSNAIRYGAGSPVTVRAGVEDPGWAYFSVTDGGPGIPEEDRARMFQKFERAVASSGHRSGFGLGLWIVARLVMAHHGTVEVTTAPAGGCIFTLRLPLGPQEPGTTGGPPA